MCALFSWPVLANVGPPWRSGQIVAEPTGLKDVAITGETLSIDLRPLESGKPALVEAIYRLDNRGPQRQLELVFASGSRLVTDFQVWLGDQAVESKPAGQLDLPKSWKPPRQTPGIHDANGIDFLLGRWQNYATPLAFTIVLPPGPHVLKVRYQAKVTSYQTNSPALYWQFAYILAPARDWGSFGSLGVTIQVPDNWLVACAPPMKRDGDVLHESFTDLPADAIALTLQTPGIPRVRVAGLW